MPLYVRRWRQVCVCVCLHCGSEYLWYTEHARVNTGLFPPGGGGTLSTFHILHGKLMPVRRELQQHHRRCLTTSRAHRVWHKHACFDKYQTVLFKKYKYVFSLNKRSRCGGNISGEYSAFSDRRLWCYINYTWCLRITAVVRCSSRIMNTIQQTATLLVLCSSLSLLFLQSGPLSRRKSYKNCNF